MRFLSRAENEAKAAAKAADLKRAPEEKVSRRNYLLNVHILIGVQEYWLLLSLLLRKHRLLSVLLPKSKWSLRCQTLYNPSL